MKSPGEKDTIQIEITNACMLNCPNCTRHCGHVKRPFFMDRETFAKALDSLVDYPGRIGVMGGEPTLHPDFEEMMLLYARKVGNGELFEINRKPLRSGYEYNLPKNWLARSRRGLWTALGAKYYQHFELIQEVFDFQAINDHLVSGRHQSLLITRKEMGIDDEEWFALRDNCWVQNCWSASITPKGAFFCEVAAAFDMLFDGPGGWALEPGWWRRRPEDFGEQLQWCELCGAALNSPLQSTDSAADIISPLMLQRLKEIASPKVIRGEYLVFDPAQHLEELKSEQGTRNGAWHLSGGGDRRSRISPANRSIKPRTVKIVFANNIDFTSKEAAFAGCTLSKAAFESMDFSDWLVISLNPEVLTPEDLRLLTENIFNPGCLYYKPGRPAKSVNAYPRTPGTLWTTSDFIFFNRRAAALRERAALTLDETLIECFDPKKVIELEGYPIFPTNNV